ncbi:hypothetical protein J2W89_003373 [Pseudarthrobacter oxydans]|nr:hypothetical protein [Pseudarthrobacter oxydans]
MSAVAQKREVAVYKGDELLSIGSIAECAQELNVLPGTIAFYLTPAYERRLALRKNCRKPLRVVRVDDEDDDE